MITILTAAAIMIASAATNQTVEVGQVKWDSLPEVNKVDRELPSPQLVAKVQTMLDKKYCQLRGQKPERFDITVRYAVLVEPNGKLTRVVVDETGCEILETMVGNMVLTLAEIGDFKPTGESEPRWYKSDVNFNLR